MATMEKNIDCVLCGSCVVDLLVRPVPLEQPIGGGRLIECDPIGVTTGGIVSNAGIAMARMGMKAAAFSFVGNDQWADVIRAQYRAEGIDASPLMVYPEGATSTTAVLIDSSGERSFAHCVGAPRQMTKETFLDHLDLFARSQMMLVGYYSLMPNLESGLAEVFAEIRKTGCRTALDAAGSGGTMDPLEAILPHLDVYFPSHAEAVHQTGRSEPEAIVDFYRQRGAEGVLGVKLGSNGALLSAAPGRLERIEPVLPPGPVVDTTGAGDSFYAGLLTGLLQGMSPSDAGRLAAATGACCVSGLGASAGLKDFETTAKLAGLA